MVDDSSSSGGGGGVCNCICPNRIWHNVKMFIYVCDKYLTKKKRVNGIVYVVYVYVSGLCLNHFGSMILFDI